MKKLTFLLVLLQLFNRSYGQIIADTSSVISFGITKTYINDNGFKSWAKTNYNKTINNDANLYIDLAVISAKRDVGVYLSGGDLFSTIALEFGPCLTSPKSKISSFLNFGFGEFFSNYTDLKPLNYTLTPDQEGKQLQLHFDEYYIALTSKNYLNTRHFHFGKDKKSFINGGFFATFGYMPFQNEWQYGYFTPDGFDSDFYHFKGVNISSIPKLNNAFFEAGIFIGIGTIGR